MKIPSLVLKQLYTHGSLENVSEGVKLSLKNRLSDATLTAINEIAIDGRAIPLEDLEFETGGTSFGPAEGGAILG